jgi:hypothetical protein
MKCFCHFKLFWTLLLAFSIISISGCGDNLPKRVPVSGQVFLDGKPLDHGVVQVYPNNQRMASGAIFPDGKFKLTTYTENDGCIIGKHPVAVNAGEGINTSKMRWYAPKKYADQTTSGLDIEITGQTDNIKINLKSDGQTYPMIEYFK